MKHFKNMLIIITLLIVNFTTSEEFSQLRPTQAEPFRNKLIEEYSNQAKNNDQFTTDFIISVNQSNLSPGYRKDVFEKAIHYYDLLQNVVQTNLDKLTNAANAIKQTITHIQPDVTTLPKPMNAPEEISKMPRPLPKTPASPEKKPLVPQTKIEEYTRNKVTAFSKEIIDDIFPKQTTLERLVFEIKDEFPGPDKENDITILYNAIINNPEIKKNITLKNAVPTYNLIKESLSNAWDKNDNIIWSR